MGKEEKNEGRKKYIPVLLVLLFLLLIAGGFWISNSKGAAVKTTPQQASGRKTTPPDKNKFENQETRDIVLNFGTTQLVLTGYPYVDKEFRPRLYNLIYVSTIFAYDDMVNLTDPSGKWANIYEFSTKEPRIYMPIGRTATNVPIWQTMDIIGKGNAEKLLGTCATTPYVLPGGLPAVAYACQATETNKESVGSVACFVALNETNGLLYRQFSGDGSVKGNMCDVLKNNYIFSIQLKSF